MQLKQGKDKEPVFNLENLSFAELKTIKDSCEFFARQGSAHAAKLAVELKKAMENLTV